MLQPRRGRLIYVIPLLAALAACAAGEAPPAGGARSGTTAAVGTGAVGAVRLIGRFDLRDAAGPASAWPSTSIEAEFSGTSLGVKLGEVGQMLYNGTPAHAGFDVSIDGGTPTPVNYVKAPATISLAQNLAPGLHAVRLTKITEANQGVAQFLGFVPSADGAMLPAPGSRAHRIEFIGDSGATGYGALGDMSNSSCQTSGSTQDSDRAYPAYVAASLDADYSNLAFSGKGITRNLSAADSVKTLPVLFARTLPDDPSAPWDFSQFVADAVVVDAGGNDLQGASCQGKMANDDAFVATYLAFLQSIHGRYPQAAIFAVLTTSGCDADRQTLAALLQRAVAQATAAGLDVTYAPFPAYDASWGLGCDSHPTANGARHLAAGLTAVIKGHLHW